MDIHVKNDMDYDVEERNLISVGYKNWIGKLQNGTRVLDALGDTKRYKKYKEVIPSYRLDQAMKLIEKCTIISKLINNKCFRLARSEES